MIEDELVTAADVRPLIERDLDDLADPFGVIARRVALERGRHGFGLGDGTEIGPGRGDLAGLEQFRPDPADGLDVPLLEPSAGRLLEIRDRSRLDEGEVKVVSRLQ